MSTGAPLRQLGEALAAFDAACGSTPAADTVAVAFATHLAALDAGKLPPRALADWERVTQLLKAPAGQRPIPARVIAAIASWPSGRVATLAATIHAVTVAVEQAANDQLADETNASVARAYL